MSIRRAGVLTGIILSMGCTTSTTTIIVISDAGTNESSVSSDADSAVADVDPGDAAPAEAGSPDAAPTCPVMTTFYMDGDGDGVGCEQKQDACTAPGPSWVVRKGDCDDTNPSVFPGATAFHGTAYVINGLDSFDYNCDGVEEEAPNPATPHFADCDSSCSGSGYAPSQRSGTGVGPFCGSTAKLTCSQKLVNLGGIKVLQCSAPSTESPPIQCR